MDYSAEEFALEPHLKHSIKIMLVCIVMKRDESSQVLLAYL